MVNDIAEDGIVGRYMLRLYVEKEKVRDELLKRGYEPDEVAKLSLDMAIEVDRHIQMGKEIAEKRMMKTPDEDPMEDFRQIFRRVDRMFGGKAYLLSSKPEGFDVAAFYEPNNDLFGLTPEAFAECSVGHGSIYVAHEGRHREMTLEYRKRYEKLFGEGDANISAYDRLSKIPVGDKELIQNYIGMAGLASQVEKKIFEKNTLGTQSVAAGYLAYVISPSIVFHLKSNGKSTGEILEYFNNASERMAFVGVKEALLEGLV
ncbi:MAG: hypothetical protein HZB68_00700 [Candidatus Aenigmarchaeota archaeon]|nr:hypothetical protein [Candidatus Aenigmarchaeota archaeon]